jgi:anti-sigma regulatory factor (Ser/Thr protein kinase)
MSCPPTPPSLRQSLPCELACVRDIARATRGFLASHGCPEPDLVDIELALVEACNNAIQYAPPHARNLSIVLETSCLPQHFELRITDHTLGFDWPKESTLPDAESERGRGLYLIRTIMDHAEYFRGPTQNVLLLRKSRNSTA